MSEPETCVLFVREIFFFLEKFTPLSKILNCRRQWQISPLIDIILIISIMSRYIYLRVLLFLLWLPDTTLILLSIAVGSTWRSNALLARILCNQQNQHWQHCQDDHYDQYSLLYCGRVNLMMHCEVKSSAVSALTTWSRLSTLSAFAFRFRWGWPEEIIILGSRLTICTNHILMIISWSWSMIINMIIIILKSQREDVLERRHCHVCFDFQQPPTLPPSPEIIGWCMISPKIISYHHSKLFHVLPHPLEIISINLRLFFFFINALGLFYIISY